jgi:CRP/FNR family transcriptional regulator
VNKLTNAVARKHCEVEKISMDVVDILQQTDLFKRCTTDQLYGLQRIARFHGYSSGRTIFEQGDAGDDLYIIMNGHVRIFMMAIDGREFTLRVYGAGSLFGEFSVLDRKPRSSCAVAIDDVSTIIINRQDLNSVIERNVQILHNIVEVLVERLRFTTHLSHDLVFLSVTERTAGAISRLADRLEVDTRSSFTISQVQLARDIGATREWTHKALHRLEEEQLIERVARGQIRILDRQRLLFRSGSPG